MLPSTMGNGIPVETNPEAQDFYAKLPRKAATQVLAVLDDWLKGQPAWTVRINVVTEPDDPDWQELVVELLVDIHDESFLALWDNLGNVLDSVISGLPELERYQLNESFGVHIVPESPDSRAKYASAV